LAVPNVCAWNPYNGESWLVVGAEEECGLNVKLNH
jgi:hypothetical protein